MPDWLEPWLAPALLVGLFAWLRADISALRTELRADINILRAELNNRIDALTATVADIDRRVARLEGMLRTVTKITLLSVGFSDILAA